MRNRGFTLIELVIVIVLLSIIAIFSFQFVGFGSQMFASSAERVRVLDQSRFVIERLSRELRNAVPSSARVTPTNINNNTTTQCVEFVPTRVAGTYYDAPFRNNQPNTLTFVSLANWSTIETDDRLFIYATRSNHIYGNNSNRFEQVEQTTSRAGNATLITLVDNNAKYGKQSPRQRLYIGRTPVSYCVEGEAIYRYANYGWSQQQPTPSNGRFGGASGTLMGSGLVNLANGAAAFQVDETTLMQNNIVHLFLQFNSIDNEQLFFSQEVHIPNAP
ncbi:MSHA biogenesis protein MshO [Idiomarina fontislapidosi]|uniref:Pilus assembly protein n=1 Tax=Idiomarina fontislapidosi TaxID=263723 RepID=A0A432Y2K3_9GAMM|nr:prepilin-type N-terminal cleavage/methylation domain-containing protein [Idiomarina fontislapidosi]PYE33341.1 MSHA biogenesis protein MshO [Idiomarina fontislapidosi]RUO55175.1 pilus assembly protein [Idiomarina fontislapidosi]